MTSSFSPSTALLVVDDAPRRLPASALSNVTRGGESGALTEAVALGISRSRVCIIPGVVSSAGAGRHGGHAGRADHSSSEGRRCTPQQLSDHLHAISMARSIGDSCRARGAKTRFSLVFRWIPAADPPSSFFASRQLNVFRVSTGRAVSRQCRCRFIPALMCMPSSPQATLGRAATSAPSPCPSPSRARPPRTGRTAAAARRLRPSRVLHHAPFLSCWRRPRSTCGTRLACTTCIRISSPLLPGLPPASFDSVSAVFNKSASLASISVTTSSSLSKSHGSNVAWEHELVHTPTLITPRIRGWRGKSAREHQGVECRPLASWFPKLLLPSYACTS